MKKHILLPLLALAGGSAGLVLHRWELSLAADTATGLLNSGQPATAVLAVLAIALATRQLCVSSRLAGQAKVQLPHSMQFIAPAAIAPS